MQHYGNGQGGRGKRRVAAPEAAAPDADTIERRSLLIRCIIACAAVRPLGMFTRCPVRCLFLPDNRPCLEAVGVVRDEDEIRYQCTVCGGTKGKIEGYGARAADLLRLARPPRSLEELFCAAVRCEDHEALFHALLQRSKRTPILKALALVAESEPVVALPVEQFMVYGLRPEIRRLEIVARDLSREVCAPVLRSRLASAAGALFEPESVLAQIPSSPLRDQRPRSS